MKEFKIMKDTTEQANITPNVIKSTPDSVSKDSTNVDVRTIKIAENDLEDNVQYKAEDSIIYDITNKTVLLYGRATIKYQKMDMAAGFIKFNWDSSEVYAKATYDDSLGAVKRVEFKDGSGEYVADEAKFNFKTKKGKSLGLVMKEMEGYLHGGQVKVVDTNTLYIKNARYTTCDLDDPHFYVEIGKAKVIKDKIIVGKPADVVIAGVRTPLFLPFAMLPSVKSKGTGLLMPTYGQSNELGFFLNNIGYFWKINDQLALTTTADVYTLGSWGLHTSLAYRKIYKFTGNLNFNINQQRGGSQYERFNPKRQKPPLNFGVQWQMNIDPKKMYNSSFNINLNIVSNKTYQLLNSRDPQSVLATNFSSNISYSKFWPGKPYRLALNTSLVQNTQSKKISLTLPQFTFNVTRINPFQRKISTTTRKWYENIGFSYDLNVSNQLNATDSTFFTKKTLKDMRNSVRHTLPISGNFTLFKYLNFNAGFNYREDWYFSYITKTYYDFFERKNDENGKIDTFYNQAVEETKYGFKAYRDFNFNMSFNTQLFGLFQFKNSKFKAIRHTFRPSLNFNFSPDFTKPFWKYNRTVQTDSIGSVATYSIFSNNGIVPQTKQGNIGVSFSNTLEIKVYSKKDSVNHTKKITLLDNLSFGMNYNILTKRFSPLNISASTHVTDKLNLSMNVSMDPYSIDSLGRQTNNFYWKEKKRLFRLTNMNISLSGSIHSKKGLQEQEDINQSLLTNQGINNQYYPKNIYERDYYNFSIPWAVNYQYSLNVSRFKFNKKDTTAITQTLALGLDFNITKKWKINISSGFDLTNKSITRTDISVIRDLHCWQMEFKWTPVGFQKGFYMTIYVTSQQFSWLKLQKQKGFFDTGIFGSGGLNTNAFGSLGNGL
ncbi:MAG TPA: putative LPS assembly protein LptD [Chitinophagales bacterium]|nr:putative LPS assembly protein LptD [Chitinophagales bacterium]